jgi:transcription initiation factor TFIID subunit 11
VAGAKKKRGRKPKNKADDDTSLVGGPKSAVSGASGRRGRGSRDASIDDYDDEEGGGDTAVAIEARTDDEAMKESELKAVLYSVLDPEQSDRLEAWRASKLADSVVRRVCYSLF